MKSHKRLSLFTLLLLTTSPVALAAPNNWPGTKVDQPAPKIKGMPKALERNLANFDDLDFRVYTDQRWWDLHKSHAMNIIVHYPDGHTTKGIRQHLDDLKYMWTFAPDNRITEHPVRFGTADAEWTAVTGFTDGTFTKPMVLPDGKVIKPTGKAYHLPMATLGHWNKQGVMDEEYLFWDDSVLMKQIGVSD
ncbi:ester cyclase [Photorhabdus aegyptia]|uniref:SnoaL-like polyketide cyclase n=1 Tax=Photorhabdus aegyptia TaxID=2805098 RepID=A0A022PQK3_9GAMM|nr:ester cyclase [Photorhabdus aegyptia]EYU17123.1 SnoaL-like polyketide cyclase [Photorhabdus aegyptia]